MAHEQDNSLDSNDTITTLEQTSINALVAYTAHDRRVSEDVVRDVFATRFGIKRISDLKRASFEEAIRFLVDVQMELIQ